MLAGAIAAHQDPLDRDRDQRRDHAAADDHQGRTATIDQARPQYRSTPGPGTRRPRASIETRRGQQDPDQLHGRRAPRSAASADSVVRAGSGLSGTRGNSSAGEPNHDVPLVLARGAVVRTPTRLSSPIRVDGPRIAPLPRKLRSPTSIGDTNSQPPRALAPGEDDVVGGEAALAEARQAVESDHGRDLGALADRDAGKPQPRARVEARVDGKRSRGRWPMQRLAEPQRPADSPVVPVPTGPHQR